MIKLSSLQDYFLIATPFNTDPRFKETVIYVCEHDHEGATGVVINSPANLLVGDVLQQMNIPCHIEQVKKQTLLIGGPVDQDRGFVLHHYTADEWLSSISTSKDLNLTLSLDILEAIAQGVGPEKNLITLGISSWYPGQLEQEIFENVWLYTPATLDIIFDYPLHQRWGAAKKLLGFDVNLIHNEPGHA